MRQIETQISLQDVDDEYKAFVDKFKPKKTTDDCYTPENIYNAVLQWACAEYGISPGRVVRPFWPGGDYKRYSYRKGDVVVDNPPFSILAEICKFYVEYEIPFFLFAPTLTNFTVGYDQRIKHIVTSEGILYENGAVVNSSFVTSLGEWFIRSAPDLNAMIRIENEKNKKKGTKQLPKYQYPDHVLTASMVGYLSTHGVELKIHLRDCCFIRCLDSQKEKGKSLFGAGFLLSEIAAAEKAAAEKAAAEKWRLSERERKIIAGLG